MRGLIILLIMVIFFLSGFVFGIQKDEQASTVETTKTTPAVEETTETVSSQPSMEQEANVYEIEEGQYSLTNKTASVLEATVKKVFDIIVGIMYEISKIFF
ncbi:hypothetical protein [Oceanobacillus kimchii]|uniref:hypothetical protein n=1 Tax=Oceanobacillus kimchii TaxID=746691 RepID=UPI0009850F12|nr:hypothetical protein [Oceanobacillus kimchii]